MPALREASLAAPREPRRDLALAVLLGGLSVVAWAALWAWSASPYARYAAHDGWLDSAAFAALCRSVPAGSVVVPAALYALAWVLMIAAMMLPTTYPVLGIFRVMTRSRADAGRLLGLILAGFFCAWFAFGLIAHALDGAAAWLGGRNLWLAEHGWVAGVAVDMVWSNLALQWVNDLPRAFGEFRRTLKVGGLLSFTTFGPDTLKELRAAFARADGHTHVNRFVDMHDLGDMLVHAGFADPVMDQETLTLTWATPQALLAELRQAGKVGDPIHLIRETRFLEQHEVGLGGANHRGDCAFASAPSVLDVVGEETHG